MTDTQLMLIDERTLKDKIYTIRGQQVMLDSDLAEIYGYETKNFNRQIRNNIERFEGNDFMFQLTREETDAASRCKNFTLNTSGNRRGLHYKYLPYVFTEQGIYMLMRVLKGDLDVQQSKTLIRLFKAMKDHILSERPILEYQLLEVKESAKENSDAIRHLAETAVTKDELSPFLQLFEKDRKQEEILILNGEPYKADLAYQKIFSEAKKELMMIDDYISSKTLKHLLHCSDNVTVIIISDNKGRTPLQFYEYKDFLKEYPAFAGRISFLQSHGKIHDRYLFLDTGSDDEKIYHCGASLKDAGEKIAMIMECKDTAHFQTVLKALRKGKRLILR